MCIIFRDFKECLPCGRKCIQEFKNLSSYICSKVQCALVTLIKFIFTVFVFKMNQRTFCSSQKKSVVAIPKNEAHFNRSVIYIKLFLPPKRSFGQGNIFTGVCLSTGGGVPAPNFRGGGPGQTPPPSRQAPPPPGRHPPQAGTPPRQAPPPPRQVPPPGYGQRSAGTHPTGMHSHCYYLKLVSHFKYQRTYKFK